MIFTMTEQAPTRIEIPAVVELPAQVSAIHAMPPTTTEEENKHALSQREVNKIWEYTQAVIAILVTTASLIVCVALVIRGESKEALILISGAFFLIIGSYFQRTNHTKVGGVQLPYQGR